MMKLRDIQIHNYKSLRNIRLMPAPLSVFVGPNAAGKSNFVDALDFLGDVYGTGLESAVARKGGYENICYRRTRRSTSPIQFQVKIEIDNQDWQSFGWEPFNIDENFQNHVMLFEHKFDFLTQTRNIQSPFHIDNESLDIFLVSEDGTQKDNLMSFFRLGEDMVILVVSPELSETSYIVSTKEKFFLTEYEINEIIGLSKTKLMVQSLNRFFSSLPPIQEKIAALKIFQFDPHHCRETGVPTPNPVLDRFGGNLPAVIAHLKTNYPDQYALLLNTVRRVMPTFEDLETYYTPRKTLGLSVKEKSFGRPWVAEDVSDGTMQTIALLTAIFDPRIPIVIIEEPENSIHPWAIRSFIEAAREAAQHRYIFLTTHSPTLIDQLKPDEVWIVSRPEAETKIDPLLALDPALAEGWKKGSYTLFEYLDSGMVSAAVPAA